MTALVDMNVILDVMLAREPHLEASTAVCAAVESGQCRGLLCATTVTTIYFIAERQIGRPASLEQIAKLMSIFGIAPVNQGVLASAINGKMADFEDAVLHEAALQAGAQCIVTRNVRNFVTSEIPIYSPKQLLAALENELLP